MSQMSDQITPPEQDSTKPTRQESQHDPWWRSNRFHRALLAALVISAVSAVIWWEFFAPYIRTDDARVAATVVAFAPTGAGGQLVELRVDEGDTIKKGDVLFCLDQRQARAMLFKAKAQERWTKQELRRLSRQAKRGFAPKRDLESAICNAQSAQADRRSAQIALQNTVIKSSLDGVVVLKSAEMGDFVQPGQTAITVADLDNAWIAVNIEETYAKRLRRGQSVQIAVDEGGQLEGQVGEILQTTAAQFALIPADSGSGNYTKVVQRIPIKIRLTSQGGSSLRVGQSVEVKIRVGN